jgi:ubiquinone/menaquinone biosynthesis C-methylase UbiE
MRKEDGWEEASRWYASCVGERGHYYHTKVLIPGALRLLGIDEKATGALLDMGCGSGVFAPHLPRGVAYWGVDASPTLLKIAKKTVRRPETHWIEGDASSPLPMAREGFDWALFLLSLQNMARPQAAIRQAASRLKAGGRILLILNHPCFRIPRQTHWGYDEKTKIQYRRIDAYLSPLSIPIETHPGARAKGPSTFSYHHSLTDLASFLFQEGFLIDALEEWRSDKESTGARAKSENRARREIPLFLALRGRKN